MSAVPLAAPHQRRLRLDLPQQICKGSKMYWGKKHYSTRDSADASPKYLLLTLSFSTSKPCTYFLPCLIPKSNVPFPSHPFPQFITFFPSSTAQLNTFRCPLWSHCRPSAATKVKVTPRLRAYRLGIKHGSADILGWATHQRAHRCTRKETTKKKGNSVILQYQSTFSLQRLGVLKYQRQTQDHTTYIITHYLWWWWWWEGWCIVTWEGGGVWWDVVVV